MNFFSHVVKLFEKFGELSSHGYWSKLPIGVFRKIQLEQLQKEYGYDSWHVSPKELRPYVLDLIKCLNSEINNNSVIVEIGCGLGEIIKNIRSNNLYGYDLDIPVIEAARYLDKNNKVNFQVGSFDDIEGKEITYLITVNFIHDIAPNLLKEMYKNLCAKNHIEYIVVDTVADRHYKYHHNFENVLPKDSYIIKQLGGYKSERKLLFYKMSNRKGKDVSNVFD